MATGLQGKTMGRLLGLGSIAAVAIISMPAAQAQETVLDAVQDITEQRSHNFYRNRTIFNQVRFITGIGGFPDQRINRDAAALSGAARELFMLQTQNTQTVRVPDLPNPYTSSVQLLPTSQINSRVIGSELNFEPLPRR
jgi:hypothetical protein